MLGRGGGGDKKNSQVVCFYYLGLSKKLVKLKQTKLISKFTQNGNESKQRFLDKYYFAKKTGSKPILGVRLMSRQSNDIATWSTSTFQFLIIYFEVYLGKFGDFVFENIIFGQNRVKFI